MKIKFWTALAILIVAFLQARSQNKFAQWSRAELELNNGLVVRTIKLPGSDSTFTTTSYKPASGEFKYFDKALTDFEFEVGGVKYAGKDKWILQKVSSLADTLSGEGAAVTILSADRKLEVTLKYLMYPSLPVVRKSIVIRNMTSSQLSVTSIDVEKFEVVEYWASTFSWIYSDYGRRRSIGPFEGGMQDALVIVHNMDWESGIVIGNEATGVLKRTAAFWGAADISAGLTHKEARFPFRKYLKAGESFETPQVFTMVYNNQKDPSVILNTALPDFVRKHMGIRLSSLAKKPTFVYNTWNPFQTNINEKLIMELAKAAADAGMKEFVIDDGWQDNYGDWNIDYIKFPNGLKPVFDYIKSLGMKPGLWLSVGSASSVSRVYHEHPEWFVRNAQGDFSNLQLEGDESEIRSACFSTEWKDYIKNILLKLTVEHGLEYLKLDFAVVTSAYVFNPEKSGCYSTTHARHVDHHESMYVNYERMWELFDELHAVKSDLFIDCTFEAMGGLQLIDYAMLKHAEGNWLSNFAGDAGRNTDLRVRNMAWWRSPSIPATALVIGNPQMQDRGWELHLKSLVGSLPIMLGDPRKLSAGDIARYRAYADWFQLMDDKYNILSYRQDLLGFGEPMEGGWDGFQRINTETKSGGIVGVFKHGAREHERRVVIQYLNPNKTYSVREALTGKLFFKATGQVMSDKGFVTSIPEAYGGRLFQVVED